MGYRRFTADYLFTGKEILQTGVVLITNEHGIVEDIVEPQDAGEGIESLKGLLTPGFINSHCHLELSHMKGKIPAGTGLVDFVARVMQERHAPPELKQEHMQLAHDEMYQIGTIAVGDICNTTDSIAVKQAGRLKWHNFIEVAGFTEEKAEERLALGKKVLDEFRTAFWPQGSISTISPHAPYSVSPGLFELINTCSAGEIITIHNQETAAENHLYQNKSGRLLDLYDVLHIDPAFFKASGKTSLQTYLPLLNKASSIILVHNLFTGQDDIEFAGAQVSAGNLFYSICINANRYIASIDPPILLLRENNCAITIGTDSYASNNQLNMLEEIKTIQEACDHSIPLTEILQWATLNGAKALQMDSGLGSFEKGKQPGVVLIDQVQDGIVGRNAVSRRII